MTADKHAKRAARELAEREGISYTAARRLLADHAGAEPEPPRVYRTAGAPCPEDCDGTTHPGAICWVWRPEDAKSTR